MKAKSRSGSRRRLALRIALNGKALDEVRTRLEPATQPGVVSYLCLPAEHHEAVEDGDSIVLRIPAITALQLYHDGVLAAGADHGVEVSIDGHSRGHFRVETLSRPSHTTPFEHVLLRLTSVSSLKMRSTDDRIWIEQLQPLALVPCGTWNPDDAYWGEEDEPIEEWAKPIMAAGPRPLFEMEQILPGSDIEDPDSDPIMQANELRDAGQVSEARELLMRLIEQDPRCLDAHAHLGHLVFDRNPTRALAHYALGAQIGRRALGSQFRGVLSWGLIDNGPYLRCLQGYGLCLWRLRRFAEAEKVFEELLWLSPGDNLGVRFLLPQVRRRKPWSPDSG
jgi:hypothetical protein